MEDSLEEDLSPPVLPEAAWLWRLFNILNRHRTYASSGPQPITVSDMAALSEIEDLDLADRRWMVEVVGKLDQLYVNDAYKKIARENEKARRQAERGSGVRRGR